MSNVVVIGAGLGGLASAALLASQGHRVAVYEHAPTVGGKLGRLSAEGLTFDTGASLLTMPHVVREVFEATGGWPEELVLQQLSPIARVKFADGTGFDVLPDVEAFCAELEAWTKESGFQWRRFHRRAERIWNATHEPFLENELRGALTLGALALRHPFRLRTVQPWRTLSKFTRARLRDARLRQFVGRYATYTGSDPRMAPAALAAIPYAEHHFGGWYIPGGLHRLADALAARCTELGVDINLNQRVRLVHTERGSVSEIELASGDRLAADIVVANADARQVYENLVPAAAGSAPARRLAKAPRSYSGFVLLLGVRGPRPPDLAHHTVLFAPDSRPEFESLAGGTPVTYPTIYLSAPLDDSVRTDDAFPVFVLVNAPRQDQFDWTANGPRQSIKAAYANEILDLMAERGFDFRNRLSFMEIRTPADLGRDTLSPGGAIYGTSSNGARSAFLRPANRTPIRGLFLVGGSAHPGGGIPIVLRSAQITSRLIGPA